MTFFERIRKRFFPKTRYVFYDTAGRKCTIIDPKVIGVDGDRLVQFTYASKHGWIRDVYVWTGGSVGDLHVKRLYPFLNLYFLVMHHEQGLEAPTKLLLNCLDSFINDL